MKKLILVNIFIFCSVGAVLAHEGHDHDGPVSVQAPKGGLIKEVDSTYVEVVPKADNLNIYVYDKNLKALDPSVYGITAKVQKPRVKGTDSVALVKQENVLIGVYKAGKIHRYTLILSVKDPKEDHADTLKFTIEPKK